LYFVYICRIVAERDSTQVKNDATMCHENNRFTLTFKLTMTTR